MQVMVSPASFFTISQTELYGFIASETGSEDNPLNPTKRAIGEWTPQENRPDTGYGGHCQTIQVIGADARTLW